MNDVFPNSEKLYRAVYPESRFEMYWRRDGRVSSAAFKDKDGLSVERGNYRDDRAVITEMREWFNGCIISLTVGQCKDVGAVVKYKPTRRSVYHSEIHGGADKALLSSAQRKILADNAVIEYYEE